LKAVDRQRSSFLRRIGEEFGNHGANTTHAPDDACPLIIRPGSRARRDQPAQQIDFLPTVLTLAGSTPGTSAQPLTPHTA
jgi:arylsulfatase A-like enzyme